MPVTTRQAVTAQCPGVINQPHASTQNTWNVGAVKQFLQMEKTVNSDDGVRETPDEEETLGWFIAPV